MIYFDDATRIQYQLENKNKAEKLNQISTLLINFYYSCFCFLFFFFSFV